jgi:hypothetical protein
MADTKIVAECPARFKLIAMNVRGLLRLMARDGRAILRAGKLW